MDKSAKSQIQVELVKLLYQQIKFALWAESVAALVLVLALWGVTNKIILVSWLSFNLLFCGIFRHVLVYFYRKNSANHPLTYNNSTSWLILFALGALLSGISWGFAGGFLMVEDDLLRQSFLVFLLIGVTAAANPLYSPIRSVYVLFLLPALLPFSIWLMAHGNLMMLLGLLSLIYIGIMLATSFYLHKLITASLNLRFENLDLVKNLSTAKETLEVRSHELEKSLSLLSATLESTTDGILVIDLQNNIESFNQKFIEMWKIPAALLGKNNDLRQMTYFTLSQLENAHWLVKKLSELQNDKNKEGFEELHLKDGRVFECYLKPQYLGNKIVGRVWSFREITERKSLEAKLLHQANFDPLTQLPNRTLLLDRLSQAIGFEKQTKSKLGILFLDVDRFKVINDTLGHVVGDKLLKIVAKRLVNCVRDTDTVARVGGDEFVVILTSLHQEEDSANVAREILKKINTPFLIDENKFTISTSIGISFYPKDGMDAETLIKNADIAMYRAKEFGRNNFQFFTEELNRKALTRLTLENKLREALLKNQFSLFYQPIINLKTQQIIAIEALLRWFDEELGEIPPSRFIPIAEDTELIIPISEWVMKTACTQIKEWQENIDKELQIAINLSGCQFKQINFFARIKQILNETQLESHSLILELTESVILEGVDANILTLNEIKNAGISIVMDDFGVGSSSLNHLKHLPIDKIKIDPSFIKGIPQRADDTAIVAAIIALANQLHLKVVAEGVENEEQLYFLMQYHCHEAQGYYIAKPLEVNACARFLKDHKTIAMPSLV